MAPVASTRKDAVASPVLSARSVARTVTVCRPPASLAKLTPDAQGANAPSSSAQLQSTTSSIGTVAKVTRVAAAQTDSPASGDAIFTTGLLASTTNMAIAASPVLPARSVALTAKVCGPAASPL